MIMFKERKFEICIHSGVGLGEGSGATMSDDEEEVQMDFSLDQSGGDGHDLMGFGPLLPTESERSLMERVRQELKIELKQVINNTLQSLNSSPAPTLSTYNFTSIIMVLHMYFPFQGFKSKIEDVREEILRKRRAGKLPGDTTTVLKNWWQQHSKWPYPTVSNPCTYILIYLVYIYIYIYI